MIKIITCFWNVEIYIEKSIQSIISQKFTEYKVYLVDDLSTDNTVEKIKSLINGDDRFILISNSEKKFKLRNMDELFRDTNLFDDEDIIVELDGDDWFYDDNVLKLINSKYNSNPKLWLTSGSWVWSNRHVSFLTKFNTYSVKCNRIKLSQLKTWIIHLLSNIYQLWLTKGRWKWTNCQFGFSAKANPDTVRHEQFKFSHLRTWKVHLWRNINQDSLKYDDGNYFISAADVAYSFPMVEMAGNEHYEFIPDILLVYNGENPGSDHKVGASSGKPDEQAKIHKIITNRSKYNRL